MLLLNSLENQPVIFDVTIFAAIFVMIGRTKGITTIDNKVKIIPLAVCKWLLTKFQNSILSFSGNAEFIKYTITIINKPTFEK
jgi:hypothetical protein